MNSKTKIELFKCEKLNAKITEKQCIINQTKMETKNKSNIRKHYLCENCEEGMKRLPDDLKEQLNNPESKVCKLWKKNPDLCKNKKRWYI